MHRRTLCQYVREWIMLVELYRCGMHQSRRWPALVLLAVMPMAAAALEPQPPRTMDDLLDMIQVHGFASQAYTATTGNNFQGDTLDGGSLNLTEVGLNASLRATANLHFAGQVLYRRAGKGDPNSIRLDYGLMDWGSGLEDGRYGVRLGRVKNPIGLYNETRDVAFTRPSIILPQSIYFDRVRNLELASDGGQLYLEHALGAGELTLQAGAGKPQFNDSVTRVFLGPTAEGDFDGVVYYARALYDHDGGRVRLGLSTLRLDMDYQAAPGEVFPGNGDVDLNFWVLSAQYNAEKWSLTAEALWEPINFRNFDFPMTDFNVTGGYVQGSYRFIPGWEGFLRYDVSYTDSKSRSGNRLSKLSGEDPYNFFTKDLAAGLRWDVSEYVMLRVEYHRIKGTNWLTLEDNTPASDTRKNWDLFSLQASFRF